MACVTGQIIRAPAAQSCVNYPKGLHHPAFVSGRDGLFEDWFSGWNLTNDLYRLLENVLVQLRMKNRSQRFSAVTSPSLSTDQCLHELDRIQRDLHAQFIHVYDRSTDSGRNRCGFQATYILATVHLVRLTTLVLREHPFRDILATALDMVRGMQSVPMEYLRATGTPVLEKVTGVAFILSHLAGKEHITLDVEHDLIELIDAIIALFAAVSGSNYDAVESLVKLRGRLELRRLSDDVGAEGSPHSHISVPTFEDDVYAMQRSTQLHEGNVDVPLWLLEMTSSTNYDFTLIGGDNLTFDWTSAVDH